MPRRIGEPAHCPIQARSAPLARLSTRWNPFLSAVNRPLGRTGFAETHKCILNLFPCCRIVESMEGDDGGWEVAILAKQ